MSNHTKSNTDGAEDPGSSGPANGAPVFLQPENPDAVSGIIEGLALEAEQQSVRTEAGASKELLALRDEVEATLMKGTGENMVLSESDDSAGNSRCRHRPARPRSSPSTSTRASRR